MTRILAVLRRLFLGGVVSLVICYLKGYNLSNMIVSAQNHNTFEGYFSLYFLMSPFIFAILTLISIFYIRARGQFSFYHQEQSFLVTSLRCIFHDFTSPFRNIMNLIGAIFNHNALGRGIIVFRFIEMVILVIACFGGIHLLGQQ